MRTVVEANVGDGCAVIDSLDQGLKQDIENYRPMLLRAAEYRLKTERGANRIDKPEVDDVVDEACRRILKKFDWKTPPKALKTYLRRTVNNVINDWFRKELHPDGGRRAQQLDDQEAEKIEDESADVEKIDEDVEPEDDSRGYQIQAVQIAMDNLTAREREAVELYWRLNKPTPTAVGDELGISRQAAKKLIDKGHNKIRDFLDTEFPEIGRELRGEDRAEDSR